MNPCVVLNALCGQRMLASIIAAVWAHASGSFTRCKRVYWSIMSWKTSIHEKGIAPFSARCLRRESYLIHLRLCFTCNTTAHHAIQNRGPAEDVLTSSGSSGSNECARLSEQRKEWLARLPIKPNYTAASMQTLRPPAK